MCDEINCDCDEVFGRPYFPDGAQLDAAVAEAILRSYPELWRQWQAEAYGPWKEGHRPGPGGFRRLHSPTYLRAVIRQYEYLREGGDRPDPALAARCEAIVAARPEIAEDRRHKLNDPFWRAPTAEMLGYTPEGVSHYYDPEYLKHKVDHADKLDDLFSREALDSRRESRRWRAASSKAAADN